MRCSWGLCFSGLRAGSLSEVTAQCSHAFPIGGAVWGHTEVAAELRAPPAWRLPSLRKALGLRVLVPMTACAVSRPLLLGRRGDSLETSELERAF